MRCELPRTPPLSPDTHDIPSLVLPILRPAGGSKKILNSCGGQIVSSGCVKNAGSNPVSRIAVKPRKYGVFASLLRWFLKSSDRNGFTDYEGFNGVKPMDPVVQGVMASCGGIAAIACLWRKTNQRVGVFLIGLAIMFGVKVKPTEAYPPGAFAPDAVQALQASEPDKPPTKQPTSTEATVKIPRSLSSESKSDVAGSSTGRSESGPSICPRCGKVIKPTNQIAPASGVQ